MDRDRRLQVFEDWILVCTSQHVEIFLAVCMMFLCSVSSWLMHFVSRVQMEYPYAAVPIRWFELYLGVYMLTLTWVAKS